ncbi:MAG: hypothetical protein EPN70_10115 [Paraburkholderia sp.]|uniref:hypothetical protein n=1 Tax=Paraburkholderia sp. TaxID=1926495 RepID=UPI0012237EB1|nr:hypothetical protein [Paraburkholderia sp.]TAM04910.1 MAG: hypothetical protein EPN70_10115 [Paraburkholderia sp.]TAM29586.1 MAG: hypothetical protein EPN59_11600 [Paraburkholderia sp.]
MGRPRLRKNLPPLVELARSGFLGLEAPVDGQRFVLKKALVAFADGKAVFVLLDDGLLVRAQASLDVMEIAYPAFFLRISRELLVPIARVTAIEALPCARGATPHRLLTVRGLDTDHIRTLIQVAHKNLKDRGGTGQARMAETRARIKIRDRFVDERISVARARIPAVTAALTAHEVEAGCRIRRYGHIADA